MEGSISMKEIIQFLTINNSKRSGSIYEEVRKFIAAIMEQNYVSFKSAIKWNGKKLPRYICIFDKLDPIKINNAEHYIFKLNEEIRPYLIKSNNQTEITIPTFLKSSYAIRFYILAKSAYEHNSKMRKTLQLRISLNELKRILGIENKYPSLSNFKKE